MKHNLTNQLQRDITETYSSGNAKTLSVEHPKFFNEFIDRFEKAISHHWNNRNEIDRIANRLQSSPENPAQKEETKGALPDITSKLLQFMNEFEDINTKVSQHISYIQKIV